MKDDNTAVRGLINNRDVHFTIILASCVDNKAMNIIFSSNDNFPPEHPKKK